MSDPRNVALRVTVLHAAWGWERRYLTTLDATRPTLPCRVQVEQLPAGVALRDVEILVEVVDVEAACSSTAH